MPTLLAVDLGTSHTVAVVQRDGSHPQTLLFDGSPVLPSGVYADAHGDLRTGRDAERLARVEPHRFEPHPKQRVDEGAVLLGDAEVEVPALLAAVLRRVLDEARNAGWSAADPVVLTCPADWGPHRREVLVSAAGRAGLGSPRLVEEPIAAAAYCTEVLGARVQPGRPLLVFDFGGGTLDLALLAVDPGGSFRVLSVGGLENLGGLDVDSVLVGHLGSMVASRRPDVWERLSRPRELGDVRDRATFWAEVRGAKEMLSRTTSAPIAVPGTDQAVYLTREELERLAGPLVDRAVDETRRALDTAGVRGGDLGAILLVGGSSRIPLVATRLHTRFGVAPTVPEQPELPVALGALRTAATDSGAPSTSDPSAGRAGPRPPAGPVYPPAGHVGAPYPAPSSPFPADPSAPGYPAGSPAYPGGPTGSPAYPGGPTAYPGGPVPGGSPLPGGPTPTSGGPFPPGAYGGTASPTTGGPAFPTSGPAHPTTGGPAFPTSAPGYPTSGPGVGYDTTSPTGLPVSGIPTSGPGGYSTVDSGQWRGPAPVPSGRSHRVVVVAASLVVAIVLAVAGVVVFKTFNGPGGDNNAGAGPTSSAGAGPGGTTPSPSVAAMPTDPAPDGFAWCDAARKLFCPTEPVCELDDDEVECSAAHDVETFSGGYLKSNAQISNEAMKNAPEVKEGCGDAVMKERALDPAKVADWARYSQWRQINGVNFFFCHAGPRQGTTKGSDFKTQ
ncbi:hypothetical protein Val02_43380 [Virgisporangium aliadipatigenens]|uniref:Hsp70 protein n=1 Tax=Virgisporangium aliadipatigenens TaxID=741659 RepID=A0A8J3YN83_9ACTN|nr:Hsp70 family protein [Virgisporangium aliadipatigenens]GIJ47452.1 hypothetical protein Val02_43380 [Virgisporangium aliadipatigenens]